MTRPSLTIIRKLKASPARVYAAWTDPEMMVRWFGPRNARVEKAECEPRVGGAYRLIMRGENGEIHDVSGDYREVIPERKLVFTWSWISTPERQSLVTVTLRDIDGGTELTLLHENFADEAARDAHQAGWATTLVRLEALLA